MPSHPVRTGRVRKNYELPMDLIERMHRWMDRTPEIRTETHAVQRLLDQALAVYEERSDVEVRK